jgi:hypothetical protein
MMDAMTDEKSLISQRIRAIAQADTCVPKATLAPAKATPSPRKVTQFPARRRRFAQGDAFFSRTVVHAVHG